MTKLKIDEWVQAAEPNQIPFRQAVHTILVAISGNKFLQSSMTMKGGVLLALGYRSQRFTQDIDFSTPATLEEFDQEDFRARLDESLVDAARLAVHIVRAVHHLQKLVAGEGRSVMAPSQVHQIGGVAA